MEKRKMDGVARIRGTGGIGWSRGRSERACHLLVSELALAGNCDEAKIEKLLTLTLAKCKLRFPEASEFQA